MSITAIRQNLDLITSNWTRLPAKVGPADDDGIPIPPQHNRARIAGHLAAQDPTGEGFRYWARDAAQQLIKVADVYGADVRGSLSVLDWGVGCGRIARFLPQNWRQHFVGIDVDPTNVAWCRANIPFGQYRVTDVRPGGRIHESNFDLIYSNSVMTHLVGSEQEFWIKKLAEVSRGLMIISAHTLRYAVDHCVGLPAGDASAFFERGEGGGANQNPDIADVTPPGYYTDVCNTPQFIKNVWGKHVEVIDILQGALGGQDVVVARARH